MDKILTLTDGLIAATFLWIGLLALVVGNRQTRVAQWFAASTLALAGLYYSQLANRLFADSWAALHQHVLTGLIGVAAVGWCAVATHQTYGLLPDKTWRYYRRWLFWLRVFVVIVGVVGVILPDLFLRSFGKDNSQLAGTFLYAISIAQVQITLTLALVVYGHAQWLQWRRHRLLLRFMAATVTAQVGALLLQRATLDQSGASTGIRVAGLVALASCAGMLLHALTTDRRLFGYFEHTRYLLLRWAILLVSLGLMLLFEAPRENPADRKFELLALTLIAPALAAAFDWSQYRNRQHTTRQYRQYARDSISGWPVASVETCYAKARQIFDTLIEELRADACHMHLQASPNEPAFDLRHPAAEEHPSDQKGDLFPAQNRRQIKIEGHELGCIQLRGPNGLIYSSSELDLAEGYAYHIASLYLYSRQVRTLEEFTLRREYERIRHNQRLQQVLHDRVLGNLDAIHKAIHLLQVDDIELAGEINEATRESESLIRNLLRGELADVHPPTLLREGLITALRNDVLPRYQSERYKHVQITLNTADITNATLKDRIGDSLMRKLYGAIEESIRNATKYAPGDDCRAVNVTIRLQLDKKGLTVVVEDDGVGFVPELARPQTGGMGLSYYEALLRTAGGILTVKSQVDRGTSVTIELPDLLLRDPEQQPSASSTPTFTSHTLLEWRKLMLEIERHQSGRLLIKDHLSDLTYPLETLTHYHRFHAQDEKEVDQLVQIDQQRQNLFHQYVQRFPFREIISIGRLAHYVFTGKDDDGNQGIDKALARDHVLHVIELLKTYEYYQLGLSSKRFEVNFAVKPGYGVLFEQRPEHGDHKLAGIFAGICEMNQVTISSFTRRFEDAWAALPQNCRDKQEVIAYLERLLADAALYFT